MDKRRNRKLRMSTNVYKIDDLKRNRENREANNKSNVKNEYRTATESNNRTSDRIHAGTNESTKREYSVMTIWAVLFFALFLIYMLSYIFISLGKENHSITNVVYGSIEMPITYTGVIVRDEKVYKADTAGKIVWNIQDGSRVKLNQEICSIQDPQEIAKYQKKLADVDKDILKIQGERDNLSKYSTEIADANQIIKNDMDSSTIVFMNNDIKEIYEIKSRIDNSIETRNYKLLNDASGSVSSLAYDRMNILNQMTDKLSIFRSNQTGIMTSFLDGCEEFLTLENLSNLSKEQTTGIIDLSKIEIADNVTADQSIFKIIKSNEWYFSAYLPKEETLGWSLNGGKTLYFADGDVFEPFYMTVYKMIETTSGEVNVIFKSTKQMTDFIKNRSMVFKLKSAVEQGLKIPNTSIVDKTLLKIPSEYILKVEKADAKIETDTVLISSTNENDEEINIQTEVAVMRTDDKFSYVMQDLLRIKLGDILARAGSDEKFTVAEVENIKGVYIMNSGYPKFRQISLDGNYTANEAYTILDKQENKGLRISDKIISDVSSMVNLNN